MAFAHKGNAHPPRRPERTHDVSIGCMGRTEKFRIASTEQIMIGGASLQGAINEYGVFHAGHLTIQRSDVQAPIPLFDKLVTRRLKQTEAVPNDFYN